MCFVSTLTHANNLLSLSRALVCPHCFLSTQPTKQDGMINHSL